MLRVRGATRTGKFRQNGRFRFEPELACMLDRSLPPVHHALHTIASLFMAAYMIARVRALDHPSGTVRLLAQRDHCFADVALLEREIEVFRSQRRRRPARHR